MGEIQHELKIRAPRDRIFRALTDGAALERWQGAKVTGNKQEWRLEYPDGTVFRWSVVSSNPERIDWRCVEGPGQAIGTGVSFRLSEANKDRSLVEFAHIGWPETDEKFRECNTRWAILLHRLQQEVELLATTDR